MLTEAEWAVVMPEPSGLIGEIQRDRQVHGTTLADARDRAADAVLLRYRQITGFEETNINALYHHRLSLLGPDCHACGKPLRTPRAKLCAECGAPCTDVVPPAEGEGRT